MEYITECFSYGIDVTHGLNTLLDKCQIGYGRRMYFCNARINHSAENIFCPEIPFDKPSEENALYVEIQINRS